MPCHSMPGKASTGDLGRLCSSAGATDCLPETTHPAGLASTVCPMMSGIPEPLPYLVRSRAMQQWLPTTDCSEVAENSMGSM